MNNYKVYFDCGTIIKCKEFELKNWNQENLIKTKKRFLLLFWKVV